MDKLRYIQTTEYYSVLQRNELSSHEKTWRNLKCILVSKKANVRRLHTVGIQLHDIGRRQNYGDSKKISGGWGWRCGQSRQSTEDS